MSYGGRLSQGLIATRSKKRSADHPAFTAPEKLGDQSKPAEQLYDTILHQIVEPIIGNTTTNGRQLHKLGKRLFGIKWRGVFAVDKIPKLAKGQYAIVNLDEEDLPGSHWISLIGDGDKVLVYDSYGREPKDIIPKFAKKNKLVSTDIGQTDKDAEQGILETNCGARCIAALILFHQFGKAAFLDL